MTIDKQNRYELIWKHLNVLKCHSLQALDTDRFSETQNTDYLTKKWYVTQGHWAVESVMQSLHIKYKCSTASGNL